MNTKRRIFLAGLCLGLAVVSARAGLVATPGSGAAGDEFAAWNNIVKGAGIITSFVDAQGVTVNFYNKDRWLDGDVWAQAGFSGIVSVEPDMYGWYSAVTFDFGRPVTISRVQAWWLRENADYAVPNISYIADTITNTPFATTPGRMPHSVTPWPDYFVTTDTGVLAQPVTMSKLIIKMVGPDPVYTRPTEPTEFIISGAVQDRAVSIWYDNLNTYTDPVLIGDTASRTSLIYNYEYCNASDPAQVARVMTYLDNAEMRDMKVILSCKELLIFVRDGSRTWTDFTNYIDTYKDHPALKGWYLADEPYDQSISQTTCESGYNLIRQRSTKPVYMAFDTADITHNVAYNYRNAYDIMMFDHYPFDAGDGEYEGLEDEWFIFLGQKLWVTSDGWKTRCQNALNQAASAGRPMVNVIQAYGKMPNYSNKRLTTYWEERFMAFWSMLKGSTGISFWAMDMLMQSVADSGQIYPGSGADWRLGNGLCTCQELLELKDAMNSGPIANGVSDNHGSVLSAVYQDPSTGQYHLMAVNDSAGNSTVTFTLSLPVTMHSAVYEFGNPGHTDKTITNNSFSDTLNDYEVHHYILYP